MVLNIRAAADLLGATPMDALEGFFSHPQTGKLYVAMTGNEDRRAKAMRKNRSTPPTRAARTRMAISSN